jgi:hypothetical protein
MSQGGRTPGKLKENEIGSASGRDNGLLSYSARHFSLKSHAF